MQHFNKNRNERFLKRVETKYKDVYDFSETFFRSPIEQIKIICRIHGSFEVLPQHFLSGKACKLCMDKSHITTVNKPKDVNRNITNDVSISRIIHENKQRNYIPFESFSHLKGAIKFSKGARSKGQSRLYCI
jgi:hypothetical protein